MLFHGTYVKAQVFLLSRALFLFETRSHVLPSLALNFWTEVSSHLSLLTSCEYRAVALTPGFPQFLNRAF